MSVKLQIYILCRDRPDYAIHAIESVISSADFNTEVIISDNSETDLVERMCLERFSSTRYIRRTPPLPSCKHFKVIVDESKAEFLVMFHDDDIMLPNYVTTLLPYMEANPTISAVGCNAEFIDGYGKTMGKISIKNIQSPTVISNSNDLILRYISLESSGIAPFPSYLYRREYISSNDLNDKHGGKYSDFTWILKVLRKGEIVWYPHPLMQYRFHGLNDSATSSIYDRLNLFRYLTSQYGIERKLPGIRRIKFVAWLYWWKCRPNAAHFFIPRGWRERVVFRFLVTISIQSALTELDFWKARWRKLIKIMTD